MTANPFAALSGTGISCHLGAWRESATEKKPPEEYIVYTLMRTEDAHADDTLTDYAVYAYLNMWSVENPIDTAAKVRAAMRAAGWEMEDERVEYEEDVKRFRTSWTWKGWESG